MGVNFIHVFRIPSGTLPSEIPSGISSGTAPREILLGCLQKHILGFPQVFPPPGALLFFVLGFLSEIIYTGNSFRDPSRHFTRDFFQEYSRKSFRDWFRSSIKNSCRHSFRNWIRDSSRTTFWDFFSNFYGNPEIICKVSPSKNPPETCSSIPPKKSSRSPPRILHSGLLQEHLPGSIRDFLPKFNGHLFRNSSKSLLQNSFRNFFRDSLETASRIVPGTSPKFF